jgi:RHS repeat-associated protein
VASYSYSLDSLGRRTARSESTALGVKSDSYAYDPISQLTGVNYASGARSTYAYDALGNRTTVTTSAGGNSIVIPYLANACNQYTQIGGLLVSYDANGNLTSDQNGNTYTYDAQNRLVSARSGTNTMYVSYDARNRVVSRTINGIITSYAYDGWNLIEDYDASGNELARYIHGPQSDDILAKISPTGAVYYIQDGNQNVTAITDATGAVQERYTYDVYGAATITDAAGNVLTVSGVGNRFLFTGREHIAEIGIYDYRNRVYSPGLGRFLQTDPIRFQAGDINIYRYVGNSPVNGRDPMGLCDDDNLGDHWPDQLNPNALVEAGNDLLAGATLLAAAGVEGAAAVVGTIGALSYGVGRLAGGH